MSRRLTNCPFCGERRRETVEDAWPRWLNKVMLDPQGAGQAHDISIVDGVPMVRRRRKVVSYNTERVRGICADCNNGWMSRLESAAKPILTPMILGEPVTLSTADQQVVAAWATKTALVLEYSHRDRHVAPPSCSTLPDSVPFPDSLVFLLPSTVKAGTEPRKSERRNDASGEEVPILLTRTMCVGRLTLQVQHPPVGSATVGPPSTR